MKIYVFGLMGLIMFFSGCATKDNTYLEKKLLTPESVEIYDVKIDNVWPNVNVGRKLLKNFPFISNEPIIDFKGKFSDQFYGKIDYRYKFSNLKDVDFWKLRTNPFLEDFIYVLPMWANEFKKVSNDLFENIGYTYNLSSKEQEILKWWIGQGGILWIEGGIYSTRYDTFKKNGEIDSKAIIRKIEQKSYHLKFFDRYVKTYLYMSKKIDFVNYKKLEIPFRTKSNIAYFSDIKTLKLETMNFLTADFIPKGDYLLETTNNKPIVSFIRYGKGGVVFLRPFEFQDKRYDGELLRWRLVYFLMNRKYLTSNELTTRQYKYIKEKFDGNNILVMHNLHFAFNSYQLMPGSTMYLNPIAKYLRDNQNVSVEIQGHTDNIGSRKYNYKLSKDRANSVKKALVKMGILAQRIFTVGYGKDKPLTTNKTEEGRALNRRVEFHIIRK